MQSKNFIVYKSSAGSGKTFTLVKEYLKLALRTKASLTKDYRGILAITFTNKAASEMKWRIVKALKEISTDTNTTLTDLVAKELNISSSELKSRAEIVLTDILHNYSDFSVGTIDSFTHRIIRTFALDLKLPINFQIELDVELVFKKVISLLINNLGKDKLITDYLVAFSLAQVEDNKSWDPEASLIEFIKEINKEGVGELIHQLHEFEISDFENIKKQLQSVVKQYERILKENGEKAHKLINDKGLKGESFSNGDKGIYNFYQKLIKLEKISLTDLFTPTVIKTLEEDKWYSAKATGDDKQAIDSIKQELIDITLFIENYLKSNEQRYNVFKLIAKNIYAMGLVNELAKLTEEYKQDENILFISEFNERISEVVNEEPTPFIFERLGDKYNHFLLDEFQDTSGMQWKNMLPLIDDSLGKGKLNLIVGDGKQSIYRWRNADVEQFVNLPYINSVNKNELLIEREGSLIRNFRAEVLNKNYRSESVIVKFNNRLFDYLSNSILNEGNKKIYNNQIQEFKETDAGYVSIDFPELVDDDRDETNLDYIHTYIKQAQTDHYIYSDICIIVRTNTQGNTIANYLIEQGIPVVSNESLLLNNANEITVILSFLKYVSNQKDLVSASVIINYLFKNQFCNEEQYIVFLRELNSFKPKSLFKLLNESKLMVDVLKITSSNLFDCCLEIINILSLNKKNPQYIRFFLDEVLSYLQSNTSNITLFIDWWERRSSKASVVIPEGINAVNIMTIHACKGLEFPIVITPYLAWGIEKPQSVWVRVYEDGLDLPVALINTTKEADGTIYKEIAENERQQQTLDSLNLLYVDFTRAVDRLHIISPKPKKSIEKNIHTWLQSFASNQAHFDKEKSKLFFGELKRKVSVNHTKKGLEQLPIKQLQFSNNQHLIKIKGASTYNSNEDITKAREYGILVHYILSQIKTIEDVDSVILNSILSGDVTDIEAEKMKVDIKKILSNKSISSYFEKGVDVKNELEILTQLGTILRPDRVVITDNRAIVIDYKTGKKNAQKYHSQMQDYEQALLSLGYESVKKILLYIHEQEVEVLS